MVRYITDNRDWLLPILVISIIAVLPLAYVIYKLEECQKRCDSHCLTKLDACKERLTDYKDLYKEEKTTLENRNEDFLSAAIMDKSSLDQCLHNERVWWWMMLVSWAVTVTLLIFMCCPFCLQHIRETRYRRYHPVGGQALMLHHPLPQQ